MRWSVVVHEEELRTHSPCEKTHVRKKNLVTKAVPEQARRQSVLRTDETTSQRQERLEAQTSRQASMRAAETPLQTQLRLTEQLERQATLTAAETPLQTQICLEEQAERQAAFRAAETSLQTKICLKEQAERQTALIAIETPLQAKIRLEEQVQQQAVIRARYTPEQLQARRIIHAEMQTEHRQNFMNNSWSLFNGSGLQYEPSTDCHNHPLIVIDSMSKKCLFCDALKWKHETAGICCSNGKVSLSLLGEPEEPLKTLYLYDTDESKRLLSKIRKYNSCFQMTSFGVDKEI
ncbi:hypothetical protein X975_00691, partial [Stegodyphus mimosarum]